ncbi:hypothetical protein GF380_03865 [Candidatus Uhrbacteria bacterium]|nr:hypothetical protein [Candidatus Uhrbacteria bacterium]MBD3284230.1 hypothetical protein [Candidatus Uhrbacteria bacterium]
MKRDLYRSIRSLRDRERGIQPDPAWISGTRERLLMQVRNTMPSAEAAQKNRKTIAAAYPSMAKLVRGPVLAVLSVAVLLLGGSIASVRAAERALPGDTLYLLKLVTEQTRIALSSSTPSKVKLKVEFTKRRVEDMKMIVDSPDETTPQKEERVSRAADILKQDLHTIKEQLDEVRFDETERREVAETAKVIDKEVTEVMRSLKETKTKMRDVAQDPEVKRKMNDASAQAADVGIKALEVLVEVSKDETAADMVSAEEIGASLTVHRTVAQETIAEALELSGTASVTTTVMESAEEEEDEREEPSSSEETSMTTTSSTSGVTLVEDAEAALQQVDQLLGESKVDEAIRKLKEASAKSFLAQSQAEALLQQDSNVSDEMAETPSPESEATSTEADAESTDGADPIETQSSETEHTTE